MKVDFFIVGAPKSGTTSLFNYLNRHPQVVMSSQKEPDYLLYLVDELSESKYPHEIPNSFEFAQLQVAKLASIISKVKENMLLAQSAELKIKEIEYKYRLKESDLDLKNMESFRKTDLVKDIQFYTDYPASSLIKITLSILITGFILSAIFVLLRHTLAINYKK